MDYNEYERRLRHKMCILLGLETLALCLLIVLTTSQREWTAIYFHDGVFASKILLVMLMSVPITLTLLSIFFRGVYVAYEIIHCVIGGILFLISFEIFIPFGIAVFLMLTYRYWIYLIRLKKF